MAPRSTNSSAGFNHPAAPPHHDGASVVLLDVPHPLLTLHQHVLGGGAVRSLQSKQHSLKSSSSRCCFKRWVSCLPDPALPTRGANGFKLHRGPTLVKPCFWKYPTALLSAKVMRCVMFSSSPGQNTATPLSQHARSTGVAGPARRRVPVPVCDHSSCLPLRCGGAQVKLNRGEWCVLGAQAGVLMKPPALSHTYSLRWFMSRVPYPLTCSLAATAQNAISPMLWRQKGRYVMPPITAPALRQIMEWCLGSST
jgi:hypothetical protein